MIRKVFFGVLALVVVGGLAYSQFPSQFARVREAVLGRGQQQAQPAKPAAPPPVSVNVAKAQARSVPIEIHTIGTVQPIATVQVKSRVDGMLSEVFFKEGDVVHVGDKLFVLDPRSYDAQLKQAEANLARDQANLASAKVEMRRLEPTTATGVTSQKQLDQARASVAALEASVKSSEAAIEVAKVQLSYTTILSPIQGRTGDLRATQGNLVKANDAQPMVTINQLRPIYVAFSVPERDLPEVRARQYKNPLSVTLVDSRGVRHPETGKLTFIDNAVDVNTGTIMLKATFDNDKDLLWPGQFVEVSLLITTRENAVTLPTSAIQNGQNGPYVYVVRPNKTVEYRPVKMGPAFEDYSVVDNGLNVGETVVIDGQLRLAPNMPIVVRNEGASRS